MNFNRNRIARLVKSVHDSEELTVRPEIFEETVDILETYLAFEVQSDLDAYDGEFLELEPSQTISLASAEKLWEDNPYYWLEEIDLEEANEVRGSYMHISIERIRNELESYVEYYSR